MSEAQQQQKIRTNAELIQCLPTSEFQGYKESFRFFDRNAKGFIVPEDFRKALREIQGGKDPSEEEITSLMKEYDPNGRGRVLFEDLVVVTIRRRYGYDLGKEIKYNFKYITFGQEKEKTETANDSAVIDTVKRDDCKPGEKSEASGT